MQWRSCNVNGTTTDFCAKVGTNQQNCVCPANSSCTTSTGQCAALPACVPGRSTVCTPGSTQKCTCNSPNVCDARRCKVGATATASCSALRLRCISRLHVSLHQPRLPSKGDPLVTNFTDGRPPLLQLPVCAADEAGCTTSASATTGCRCTLANYVCDSTSTCKVSLGWGLAARCSGGTTLVQLVERPDVC